MTTQTDIRVNLNISVDELVVIYGALKGRHLEPAEREIANKLSYQLHKELKVE